METAAFVIIFIAWVVMSIMWLKEKKESSRQKGKAKEYFDLWIDDEKMYKRNYEFECEITESLQKALEGLIPKPELSSVEKLRHNTLEMGRKLLRSDGIKESGAFAFSGEIDGVWVDICWDGLMPKFTITNTGSYNGTKHRETVTTLHGNPESGKEYSEFLELYSDAMSRLGESSALEKLDKIYGKKEE